MSDDVPTPQPEAPVSNQSQAHFSDRQATADTPQQPREESSPTSLTGRQLSIPRNNRVRSPQVSRANHIVLIGRQRLPRKLGGVTKLGGG